MEKDNVQLSNAWQTSHLLRTGAAQGNATYLFTSPSVFTLRFADMFAC